MARQPRCSSGRSSFCCLPLQGDWRFGLDDNGELRGAYAPNDDHLAVAQLDRPLGGPQHGVGVMPFTHYFPHQQAELPIFRNTLADGAFQAARNESSGRGIAPSHVQHLVEQLQRFGQHPAGTAREVPDNHTGRDVEKEMNAGARRRRAKAVGAEGRVVQRRGDDSGDRAGTRATAEACEHDRQVEALRDAECLPAGTSQESERQRRSRRSQRAATAAAATRDDATGARKQT